MLGMAIAVGALITFVEPGTNAGLCGRVVSIGKARVACPPSGRSNKAAAAVSRRRSPRSRRVAKAPAAGPAAHPRRAGCRPPVRPRGRAHLDVGPPLICAQIARLHRDGHLVEVSIS